MISKGNCQRGGEGRTIQWLVLVPHIKIQKVKERNISIPFYLSLPGSFSWIYERERRKEVFVFVSARIFPPLSVQNFPWRGKLVSAGVQLVLLFCLIYECYQSYCQIKTFSKAQNLALKFFIFFCRHNLFLQNTSLQHLMIIVFINCGSSFSSKWSSYRLAFNFCPELIKNCITYYWSDDVIYEQPLTQPVPSRHFWISKRWSTNWRLRRFPPQIGSDWNQ